MNAILMAAVIFSGNLIGGTQVQLTDKQKVSNFTCEAGHVAIVKRYQRQQRGLCWSVDGDNVILTDTESGEFTRMPKVLFDMVDEA